MSGIVPVILLVIVWMVASNGLELGQTGVCPIEDDVMKLQEVKLRTPCPRGMRKLTGSVCNKLSYNKKTHYCCGKRTGEKVIVPGCCDNWQYIKGTCVPECKYGCGNGHCVAPDVCQCDPPLAFHDNKCVPPVCDPICGTYAQCDNDTCKCEAGYIFYNTTHCVAPCEIGYINDAITLDCVPKCDTPCLNSTCTAPNTCSCIEGHKKKSDFSCVPDCNPSCFNSDCVEPNVCSCKDGYMRENSTVCSPICDTCVHGDCIAPNICKCHDGYNMEDNVCKPVCDKQCNNGQCSGPNVCTCDPGFENDPKNKFNCLPICEPKCVNASCDSPNTCSCYRGYEKAGNDFTCAPSCEDCRNGECIAPNICKCINGFSKKDDEKCTPDCEKPCANGTCTAPNICTCKANYKLDNSDKYVCLPICEKGCVNATCVAPNSCKCLDGYTITMEASICKPKCNGCENALCVAPNKCQCYEGFSRVDDVICSPICHRPCTNGVCTSPDVCTCKDEYIQDEKNPSICFKPCKGLCGNGACTLNGECNCNRGYELINDTCQLMHTVACNECVANCTGGECWCDHGAPCEALSSTPSLAGLEVTWTLCGAISLLLVVLMMVVMSRIWKRRKQMEAESPDRNTYGSVVYASSGTVMTRIMSNNFEGVTTEPLDENVARLGEEVTRIDGEIPKETFERLLTPENGDE